MLIEEVDQDYQIDDAFRVAVDRGVEERPVAVDLAGRPGEGAIENIEEPGERQDHATHQEPARRHQQCPDGGNHQAEQGEHVGGYRRVAKHADEPLGPAPHPGLEFLGKHQRGLRLGSSRTDGAGWARSIACL